MAIPASNCRRLRCPLWVADSTRSMQHTNRRLGGRSVAVNQRPRIPTHTDGQKALMWERWKARLDAAPDCPSCSIAPIPRFKASSRRLAVSDHRTVRCAIGVDSREREEISRALGEGQSIRAIAATPRPAPSTVSRELRRNGGQAAYRASQADYAAWDRARRPKGCKLAEAEPWRTSWPTSFACCGHPSKSPDGGRTAIRMTRAIACHTRPSTAACSSRGAAP